MSIYQNLELYFDPCTNCGECCKIPGVFLPQQIEALAAHFGLDRKELFNRYLVAELYAPDEHSTPVFMIYPVKVRLDGKRLPQRVFDPAYYQVRYLHCIFRDNLAKACTIDALKPFECAAMLCQKMTGDKPFYVEKAYFYRKWKGAQDLVFDIFPDLRAVWERLEGAMQDLRRSTQERNRIMNYELAAGFRSGTEDPGKAAPPPA